MTKKKQVTVLDVSEKDLTGIGKFIVSSDAPWNIPHLHFVIFQEDDGYVCTNMELALDSWGDNPHDAVKNLVSHCLHYLNAEIRTEDNFDAMVKTADDHLLDDLWRLYRHAEFKLAKHKRDIGNSLLHEYLKEYMRQSNEEQQHYTPKEIELERLQDAA